MANCRVQNVPPCYDWNNPPELGCYIECAVGPFINSIQLIIVAVTIIMVILLIRKTAMSWDNPQILKEIPKNWMYVLLLAIVAIGGAGAAISILIKFLGFGSFQTWLDYLNELLDKL